MIAEDRKLFFSFSLLQVERTALTSDACNSIHSCACRFDAMTATWLDQEKFIAEVEADIHMLLCCPQSQALMCKAKTHS